MSPRTWNERIQDILDCAENIQKFTHGQTVDSFRSNPVTIRAVAFELITIGEAVRAIPEEIRLAYPLIPWEAMQGIRNVLVHEYFRMDEEILWETVQKDIPSLIQQLKQI